MFQGRWGLQIMQVYDQVSRTLILETSRDLQGASYCCTEISTELVLLSSGRTIHRLPSSLMGAPVHPQLTQLPSKVTEERSFLLLSNILLTYL